MKITSAEKHDSHINQDLKEYCSVIYDEKLTYWYNIIYDV